MSQWKLVLPLLAILWGPMAVAHGGGLDASGCHTNRKTAEYHCHGSGEKNVGTAATSATESKSQATDATVRHAAPAIQPLPPGCHVGPRGGTYTITKSGKKNYSGC